MTIWIWVLTRARTLATLAVLVVVVLLGVRWGLEKASAPYPPISSGAADVCVDRPVAKGDPVTPEIVTVSVLNAGERDGLSARTLQELTDDGFAGGRSTNAPAGTKVDTVQIWTTKPKSPAVRLLRTFLGKGVEIVNHEATEPGINVVVGDKFTGVVAGRDQVTAGGDTVICGP